MSHTHPFQKLCHLSPTLLVAAAGSHLYGIDINAGELRWQYPPPPPAPTTTTTTTNGEASLQPQPTDAPPSEEPASKRRKLDTDTLPTIDNTNDDDSDDSISITTAPRPKGARRKPKPLPPSNLPPPTISHILSASGGQRLIVLTAEDKSISVFNVTATGLQRQSKRAMPKKMCAATTVLRGRGGGREWVVVGDKFGDVWEVPVVQDEGWKSIPVSVSAKELGGGEVEMKKNGGGGGGGGGGYEPSATDLTVHTKRNLLALEQQKKLREKKMQMQQQQMMVAKADQKGEGGKDEEAGKGPGVEFEGRLLLGHVSLLTDVVIAGETVVSEDEVAGKKKVRRQYVLTSDRDEHVRVSRYPQTHVIEGFCLGMREFVSCVSVVGWKEEWALVGTGEPSLRVFEWKSGRCLDVVGFQEPKMNYVGSKPESFVNATDRDGKIAVRGIWPVQLPEHLGGGGVVLVALEGYPTLFSYTLLPDGHLSCDQTIDLGANVLDVATAPDNTTVVVSVDTVHEQGSTQNYCNVSDEDRSSLVAMRYVNTDANPDHAPEQESARRWEILDDLSAILHTATKQISDRPTIPDATNAGGRQGRKGPYSPLGEFLYGLENLRKRRDLTAQEAEEDGGLVEGEGETPVVL